ncbi:bro [Peridroma alphabaculovirus]|uniref:Bro n=1 Tax=Peridroma alphabaculovirus TaxID=1346829 RepID=A0A068LK54_9ABAC|nr:bro [Peridroma alphabaculovirus]AIE47749.1 bro [Peridroma alphabaculovirus]
MAVVRVKFGTQDLEVISLHDEKGQLWMLANPFARILKYTSAPNAVTKFVSKKNQKQYQNIIQNKAYVLLNIQPKSKFVNQSGLIELVFKSKMRYAAEFRYWLVNKLFPSLKINALNEFYVWRNDPNNTQILNEEIPKRDEQDLGCVYIITNDLYEKLNLYKIGYTHNLKDRLSELNVASAYDFRPVLVVPTEHCRRLESLLHSKYNEQRVKREFFQLTDDNLRTLTEFCNCFVLNEIK